MGIQGEGIRTRPVVIVGLTNLRDGLDTLFNNIKTSLTQ